MVEKLALPFSLLSDTDGLVAKAYGVWDENVDDYGLFAPTVQLPKPAIFVIDEAGVVSYTYIGVDFADRPDDRLIHAKLNAPKGFR